MPCKACESDKLQRLDGELTVTPPDLNGPKIAPVYFCRNVLVCLDCGFAELVIPAEELRSLKKGKSAIDSSPRAVFCFFQPGSEGSGSAAST